MTSPIRCIKFSISWHSQLQEPKQVPQLHLSLLLPCTIKISAKRKGNKGKEVKNAGEHTTPSENGCSADREYEIHKNIGRPKKMKY